MRAQDDELLQAASTEPLLYIPPATEAEEQQQEAITATVVPTNETVEEGQRPAIVL
jgi:hypothetical protein